MSDEITKVVLDYVKREYLEEGDDRDLQANIMGGWDVHTGILEDVLKGIEPRPFWKTHARLAAEYAATL